VENAGAQAASVMRQLPWHRGVRAPGLDIYNLVELGLTPPISITV
jgi:hypothetical protein